MWTETPLNYIFFAAAAIRKRPRFDISKNEMIVLTGLNIVGAGRRGQSTSSLHRFFEKHHHCWEYRNFKKLMDRLEQKNLIKRTGLYYSLTTNGMATLVFIDKSLKRLLKETTV